MARARNRFDILIVGDHPCAWLCATNVASRTKAKVGVVTQSKCTSPDRLVLINPALFSLDKSLSKARAGLELTDTYGLEILTDDPQKSAEHRGSQISALVGNFADVQAVFRKSAQTAGVDTVKCREFAATSVDDATIECQADGKAVSASLLAYAHSPKIGEHRALGLVEPGRSFLVKYSWWVIPRKHLAAPDSNPVITMSLELQGVMRWSWLLRTGTHAIAAVELPLEEPDPAIQSRMQAWCEVLVRRERLSAPVKVDSKSIQSMTIGAAGALMSETVGNRTLLFGPAGGFYSAGCEDVYPNCWSAVCAAETLVEAVSAKHAQDVLQGYRARWGATLGDYLRGPQQNLKFLLPLVYRNKMMAARIAEAILRGASVVR
jgi:hypothetical protein